MPSSRNHQTQAAPVSRHFAPYGASAARSGALSPNSNTNITHVITVVKSPQGNRVFSRTSDQQIERITLSRTISDAIIGKYLVPGTAIDADVRPFDAARGVLDIKNCSDTIAGDLGFAGRTDDRRSVINIYRLADSLS